MNIAIDLDSTLNTLDLSWAQWVSKVTGRAFSVDDMTDYDMSICTGMGPAAYDFLRIAETFLNLGVEPGSQAVVKKWWENHTCFIVSSCINDVEKDKKQWLRKNFPFVSPDRFISCTHKWVLDVDLIVDDAPHNFVRCDGGGRNYGIVFDKPWNRKMELSPDMIRCKGWDEVVMVVDAMEKNRPWKSIVESLYPPAETKPHRFGQFNVEGVRLCSR